MIYGAALAARCEALANLAVVFPNQAARAPQSKHPNPERRLRTGVPQANRSRAAENAKTRQGLSATLLRRETVALKRYWRGQTRLWR